MLILAEIAVRAFFPPPPQFLPFVAHDFELGHKGPPGAEVKIFGNLVKYSPEGFRVLPVIRPIGQPARDAKPIAWLGDSMVEAITIGEYEHFASQVSAQTGSHGLLFAAGDWGNSQELMALKKFAPEDLQAIVLVFSSLTDFVNNAPGFAGRYQSRVDNLRPYAFPGKSGLEISYLHPWYQTLRRYSRLFLFFDNARLSRLMATPIPPPADCQNHPNSVPLQGYFTESSKSWQDAVDITALLLREFKDEAARRKVPFLAVYLPNDFELLDQRWEEVVRAPFQFCYPGRALDRREIERKFLEAAKRSGVDAVSLYDFFSEEISKQHGKPLFLEDGHLNPVGHFLYASVLTKILRARKIVP